MGFLDNLHRRIAALAVCLDPVAFQNAHDQRLAERRQAAWAEAASRIGASATAR